MRDGGNVVENEFFFDTLKVRPQLEISEIRRRAHEAKINVRYFPDGSVTFFQYHLLALSLSIFKKEFGFTVCSISALKKTDNNTRQ